jgi:hypothetical protein
MADLVIVSRLKRLYIKSLYWSSPRLGDYTLEQVLQATPVVDFCEESERTETYDLGRIRYFYDQICSGEVLTPILVDWIWQGMCPSEINIIDGHHRFAAHVLAKKRWIPAEVGGPVDAIEWLTGKRKIIPAWI